MQGHPALDRLAEAGVKLERLDFESYIKRSAIGEPIGPVPVLDTDLLVGR